MTIVESRLTALDDLVLKSGGHSASSGNFCFNEAAAWLAGEKHSDAPECVSPYLRSFTMRLNDRWTDEQRQTLLPYLPRVIGTGGDGKDEARRRIAQRALCTDLLPPWLRLAGLDEMAAEVEGAVNLSTSELRELMWRARDAGWEKRRANMETLRAEVRKRLASQPAVAVAAAAAVAAAVADAVAAAVAVASPEDKYRAAYNAARQYYRDNPLFIGEEVANLAETQRGTALVLLDRLIDANEVSA